MQMLLVFPFERYRIQGTGLFKVTQPGSAREVFKTKVHELCAIMPPNVTNNTDSLNSSH